MKTFKTPGQALLVAGLLVASVAVRSQEGVTKGSIVIGQSLALTGPGSSLAQPFHQGAKMFFDRVNAAGGVGGRKIELVTLDDRGNPANTVANTKKLLEQGVFSLFGFYGSSEVTAAYPVIKDTDVLLFAPMAAADESAASSTPTSFRCGLAIRRRRPPSPNTRKPWVRASWPSCTPPTANRWRRWKPPSEP